MAVTIVDMQLCQCFLIQQLIGVFLTLLTIITQINHFI